MVKHIILFLKITVPLALIAWLLSTIDSAQWQELNDRPKHWGLLTLALLLEFLAVCLTFVRWYLLVRSLEITFSLADAFRLSFLGYLLNFVSAGSVGGDLFKAFFIAREQPRRRTEAVATVIVDRLVGLYALLVVASVAILLATVETPSPAYLAIRQVTLTATFLGGVVVILFMIPGFTECRIAKSLTTLPHVGDSCERVITSVRMYRNRRIRMAGIFGLSMSVHALAAVSIYLVAQSLFGEIPSLADHLVIVPLSMAASALPLTPAGLGSLEFAMDELYRLIAISPAQAVSGVMIALVYRLGSIGIAAVGVVYYWSCRAKVAEVLEAAQVAPAIE